MAELSPHQVVPPRSRSDFMAATRDGGGGPAAITCAHSLSNEKLNMARSRMRSRSTYDPRRKRRTNACRRRDGCELGCRSAPLPINKARPRAPQRTTSPSIGIALHNNRRTTTYGNRRLIENIDRHGRRQMCQGSCPRRPSSSNISTRPAHGSRNSVHSWTRCWKP
jgi:hypothetical protein